MVLGSYQAVHYQPQLVMFITNDKQYSMNEDINCWTTLVGNTYSLLTFTGSTLFLPSDLTVLARAVLAPPVSPARHPVLLSVLQSNKLLTLTAIRTYICDVV